jgi:hypothetical protein
MNERSEFINGHGSLIGSNADSTAVSSAAVVTEAF